MSDIETQLPALLEAKMLAAADKFLVMRRTNIVKECIRAVIDLFITDLLGKAFHVLVQIP